MDMYLTYGWMNSNKKHYYLFIGDQQGHMGNPQAQGGGTPARQRRQPGVGCCSPGGNSGPIGRYGWDGVAPQGYKANSGSTTMLSGKSRTSSTTTASDATCCTSRSGKNAA
jgi:hypothetical protein